MKSLGIAAFVLITTLAATTPGQVKSVAAANNQPPANNQPAASNQPTSNAPTAGQNSTNATRARVFGQDAKTAAPRGNPDRLQAHAKPDSNNHPEAASPRSANAASDTTSNKPSTATSRSMSPSTRPALESARSGHTSLKPANVAKTKGTSPGVNTTAGLPSSTIAAVATNVYRVGVRDVLDIQLSDNPGRTSTLFTVLAGGMLEYPFAGGPIPVAGLTTSEIAALLRQRIKIFDNPTVSVNVRDYASHAVTINGFVAAPGTKTLRRDAVPLYTLLAEALVLPEAARATITRPGRAPIVIDLKDANLSATLVVPGDAIKVSGLPAGPTEFFFIGGEINSPGQKPYNAGLTLTQAILASGGTNTRAGAKVRVSRQGADGLLVTEEYNLRKILNGKLPDPVVQKGDRIEVTNAN